MQINYLKKLHGLTDLLADARAGCISNAKSRKLLFLVDKMKRQGEGGVEKRERQRRREGEISCVG